MYEFVRTNAALAAHVVRPYRSHRSVTKNDLETLVTKLLSKIKSDKACALEEQHYIALDGLVA